MTLQPAAAAAPTPHTCFSISERTCSIFTTGIMSVVRTVWISFTFTRSRAGVPSVLPPALPPPTAGASTAGASSSGAVGGSSFSAEASTWSIIESMMSFALSSVISSPAVSSLRAARRESPREMVEVTTAIMGGVVTGGGVVTTGVGGASQSTVLYVMRCKPPSAWQVPFIDFAGASTRACSNRSIIT